MKIMPGGGRCFQGVKPLNLDCISRFAAYYPEWKRLIWTQKKSRPD